MKSRALTHFPSVDQSDRRVPYNLRQSGKTPIEMLIFTRVRKSPFWHLSLEAGAWRATIYNRIYHPFGYVRPEDGGPMVEYEAIKNHVTLWDVAVEQSGEALEYADDSLKSDREFMLEAVKQHSSEGPRIFAQQKANILLHELRAYLEPEAFDQFLDAEEGSDSYRINCVYEKGDGNSEYAEWYDNREIVFFPTWMLTYDLFWAGDPQGHSTFKETECEVLLATEEALDDFVNWVKERVDWEELEENWNNVMADESLKADIDMEPLFQVEA